MLTIQFNQVLKRFEKRSSNYNSKNNKSASSLPSKKFRSQNIKKEANKPRSAGSQKEKTFKCRECEGYGHFQVECPNFLKKQNKSYVLTLYDDDSDGNNDSEEDVKALVSNISFAPHLMRILSTIFMWGVITTIPSLCLLIHLIMPFSTSGKMI